jgi:hypothetical protein
MNPPEQAPPEDYRVTLTRTVEESARVVVRLMDGVTRGDADLAGILDTIYDRVTRGNDVGFTVDYDAGGGEWSGRIDVIRCVSDIPDFTIGRGEDGQLTLSSDFDLFGEPLDELDRAE